jgi:hypothetical protein
MCRTLSPASFLAVAFRVSMREELDYGWLNTYRSSMRAIKLAGEPVDVSWDHDSVNYTMGFFSPLFSANATGVHCNLEILELHYKDITQEIDKKLLKSVQACARSCGKSKRKKATGGRRKTH